MGFLHQLQILLWKNFILKKRSPLVMVFEQIIPLVLFFILIAIRKNKPVEYVTQQSYTAVPLPSAGIIPVMQIFCPTSQRDPFGFPDHPNSDVTNFLNLLENAVNKNKLFNENFDLHQIRLIPDTFSDLLLNNGSIENKFSQAPDFSLGSVLKNKTVFHQYLVHNLSMSDSDADAIIDHPMKTKEVYKLLYGSPPRNQSDPYQPENLTDYQDYLRRHFGSLNNGALYRHKSDGSLYNVDGILDILTGTEVDDSKGDQGGDPNDKLTSERLVQSFEDSLFSPVSLQDILCDESTVHDVYDTDSENETSWNSSRSFADSICNREGSDDVFKSLSRELHEQIDTDKVISALNITNEELERNRKLAQSLLEELQRFAMFQQSLQDLYTFALVLPQDSCPEEPTPAPAHKNPHPPMTSPSPTPHGPLSSPSFSGNITTPQVYIQNRTGNGSYSHTTPSLTSNYSTSTKPATTTPTYTTTEKENTTPPPGPKDQKAATVRQLYKMWAQMQKTLCGVDVNVDHDVLERGDYGKLTRSFTKEQKRSLGLLLHVLFSNPAILYTPNTPDVNDLIDKASDFIYFAKNVTFMAETWLNISHEVRDYLHENTTITAFERLGELEKTLAEHPEFLQNVSLSPAMQILIKNDSMTSPELIERHLSVLDNVACAWLSLVGPIKWDRVFTGFKNESAMVDFVLYKAAAKDITVFASLVFNVDKDGNLPNHIVYKIRQNSTYTARTDLIRRRFWTPGPEHHAVVAYYHYGFVWLQDIIDRAIIDKRVGRRVTEPGGYVQGMPYPCYVNDNFLFMISKIMPMIMIISWVYYVAMLTRSIVYEKEQRLKEVMKMMGLNNAVHWVAWFITSFVQMAITIVCITLMMHYGNVLMHSNAFIVWITFTLFSLSMIVFCFMISVFFSKAKIASACAGIMYFTCYVPCIYVQIREESLAFITVSYQMKIFASLLSPTAFGLGARYFALYEIGGVGVHWNNIMLSPVEHDSLSLFHVWLMLIVDTFLYALIAWYVEGVYPGSYGLPKPWYFPFQLCYWRGTSPTSAPVLSVIEEDQELIIRNDTGICCEREPSHLRLGVSIENLTKVYKEGHKLAVNKLSLNMYEGQITSFLGHNGAGKTTTMSILTGLFPPTSGTAKVYSMDIRSDMLQIRKSLGMCPQHNALFDKLTVEEHMLFYGQLKGVPRSEIKEEMDKLIIDVGLRSKRHCRVECLSGGMQRKLSVAVAFVGGSKTVILDEPTAGVDPYSRRAIWDLLLKYKQGRTILLSTHHMDEADVLGDRIAIISHGQLKCVGSSLFLKTTFGDGYKLTIVKRPISGSAHPSSSSDLNSSFHSNCNRDQVTRLVVKHINNASLDNETLQEFTYQLPYEAVGEGCFQKLFKDLQEKKDVLSIDGYGLMDSTLEEVFLKVAESSGVNSKEKESTGSTVSRIFRRLSSKTSLSSSTSSQNQAQASPTKRVTEVDETEHSRDTDADDDPLLDDLCDNQKESSSLGSGSGKSDDVLFSEDGVSKHRLKGLLLHCNQFIALIVKRFHHIKRNRKSLFSQLLLPALYVTLAMSVALSAPHISDLPPLILTTSMFHPLEYPDGNYIPYTNEVLNMHNQKTFYSTHGDARPVHITKTLKFPAGIGATCVLKTPFNGTLDKMVMSSNLSRINLTAQFYDSMCSRSFKHGKPLSNYVPETSHADDDLEEQQDSNMGRQIKEVTCHCSAEKSGFSCPEKVGTPEPPKFTVITSDSLQDCTNRNMTDYLLYTTDKFRLHRYGALSVGNVRGFVPIQFDNDVPVLYRKIAIRNVAMAWHNQKGYHSLPTYVNALNNAILRANINKNPHLGNPSGYGITVINHPMNKTGMSLSDEFIQRESTEVLIAVFVIIAMSFVPASFVVFLVGERSSKAKLLQYVSGVNPLVYWSSNYVWDMMNYLVPAFCCISIFKIFDIPAYSSPTNLPAVIILFLLYGYSITPMMYPTSFFFTEPSSAYVFLIVINLFTGITTIVGTFMIEIFIYDDKVSESFQSMYNIVHKISLIFPNYCLGRGLMDLAYNDYMNEYYQKIGDTEKVKSPFNWDLMNRMYLVMAIEGFAAFVFVVLCEYRFFIKGLRMNVDKKLLPHEDEDVLMERQRILTGGAQNDILVLKNLTKIYKTRKLGRHLAVDGLCLGVAEGECFGLLGVNGAGKTTTFKMLTQDERITGGDAFINGISVRKDKHKNIGYCPQFDALFDELTAREHLQLYARLKGISRRDEGRVVQWALQKLALVQYADIPSGCYSGGNKRKLSTAIALIGHPPLIFMDEPTTGMDPHSRRFLWKLVQTIVKEGKSVVLTSHSMEECEALCSRIAIMVNAKFKCLGSAQHLKNKFGDGYTITLRVKGERPDLRKVCSWFSKQFPKAELKEDHHNIVQYNIKLVHVNLKDIFEKLEDNKLRLGIEDYSVSQTTLDNVFVNFAKEQVGQQEDSYQASRQARWNFGDQNSPLYKTLDENDLMLDENEDDDEEFLLKYKTFKHSRLTFDFED